MSNPTILVENFNGSLGALTGVDPIRYDSGLWLEQGTDNYLRTPIFEGGPPVTAWSATRSTIAADPTVTLDGIPSGLVTATDISGAIRLVSATANDSFTVGDPIAEQVSILAGAAGMTAKLSVLSETNAGGVIDTVAGSFVAISTTQWTKLSGVLASSSATTQRARMFLDFTALANGDKLWVVKPQIEKLTYSTSFAYGGMGAGYSQVTPLTTKSTRAASSASITIAEPAAVACWYREGYSGAKTFAYIEPYGTLGTYGSIAWSGGTLTLSTSRNLVIGPFAAFDRELTANEQANLRSTQNWSMNSVNGSNIILPLSGRRRPR